ADWAGARLVSSGSAPDLGPVTGRGARIEYTLASKGRVSMHITDAQGRIIRDLLRAAPREAGRQVEIWDGLDDQGLPAPAGTYRFRLLGTPGFKAEYLMSLGNNYPRGNHYRELSPGSHHGTRSVAIDETGIYVAAGQTENIENMMVKMSLDGSQRLWSAQHQTAWKGVQSLAVEGSELYALSTNTTPELWVFNRATGQRLRTLSIGGPSAPVDVAAQAGTLVVAYNAGNMVRWLDTQGTQLASAAVTAPRAVAVNAAGQTYVLTGTEVRALNRTGTSSVVVSGLVDPISLDIDRASGDFLVAEGGTSQRVRRFRSTGTLVAAYGREGGRLDGTYDATTQRNFRGVSEVKATADGGFLVAEPYAAPRRVARFDSTGAVVGEWYGGQVWAPWALPDPEDPSTVWMASQWDWMMKLKLDFATRTWRVVATYRYDHLASGLVGEHYHSAIWGIARRNGVTYLIKQRNRAIIKVDEVNQKLMPVSWGGNVSLSNLGAAPDVLEPWLLPTTRSALWTDQNGDGLPQQSEVVLYTTTGAQPWHSVNAGFDFYYYENQGVRRVKAGTFNVWGAPSYPSFPDGDLAFPTPSRVTQIEDRWGSYFARDEQTGEVFGAFNDRAGFGTSEDSFVGKWKADGTPAWLVGGPTLGHESAFVPPGAIGTFRRIAGVVDGSVVLTDFYEGPRPATTYVWDRDGLWVGGVLDNPDTSVAPGWMYGLGAETLASTIVKHPVTGEVYLLGTSINEVRVYRITGWDGWVRMQGDVQLGASPGTSTPGTGFRVDFYGDTALSTPVGTQHLATVDLSDRSLPGVRGARWTGELVPPSTTTYTFRVRADDGVRLWVDGKLVVDAWADTPATRDVTGTVALVAGQRTRVQLDHYRRFASGNSRLFWSATGLTEQAVPTERVVPTNPLSERPEA
ncbi:MAG TPA: PA14 domain-containing protein, partial [Archangium sp.]|nr:PA14 domain-containing protein [Archangium sp.]